MALTKPKAEQIEFIPGGGLVATNLQDVVEEVVSDLAASGGAGMIGYMPAGTGAVATTVQAKLRETVSVFDFMSEAQKASVLAGTATEVSTEAQLATNTGKPVVFPAGNYKISGVTYTGTVVWKAQGKVRIYSDGAVLSVTNGPGTLIDGFELSNISTPYVVTRNHESWGTTGVVSQTTAIANNSLAYQPTENDFYDGVWASLTPAQQSQNIGPTIAIYASDYSAVLNITGSFVVINIHNSSFSEVSGCSFRAGKGFAGGIVFWNAEVKGYFNRAIGNTVRFASYSGISFCGNYDGQIIGNTVEGVGESGIKTYQNTSGGSDFRCYRMQIEANITKFCVYDGFDLSTDYPHTGTVDVSHQIIGNRTYNNRQTGFYADGNYSQFVNNNARQCGLSGFELKVNNCDVSNNRSDDCNTRAVGATNHLQVIGSSNKISGNYARRGASAAGYAMYAPNTNIVINNFSPDGVIFLGVDGAVTSISDNNVDTLTGYKTIQCFQLAFFNNGGTLQHLIKQDSVTGGYGSLANRVAGSTASLTNTPTGPDASTAFAAGVKIGSASTNRVYLDTSAQFIAKTEAIAVIDANETGTALTVAYGVQTININGVTRDRPVLEFKNATTGAAFAINATNIPVGKALAVKVLGKLA